MKKITAVFIMAGLVALVFTGCGGRWRQRIGDNGQSAAGSAQQSQVASGAAQSTQSDASDFSGSNSQNAGLQDIEGNLDSMGSVVDGMDSASSQDLSIPTP